MAMFIAAVDNTGIVLGMILYCLAKYTEESEIVKKEI